MSNISLGADLSAVSSQYLAALFDDQTDGLTVHATSDQQRAVIAEMARVVRQNTNSARSLMRVVGQATRLLGDADTHGSIALSSAIAVATAIAADMKNGQVAGSASAACILYGDAIALLHVGATTTDTEKEPIFTRMAEKFLDMLRIAR
jgi:hypothetical protein